MNEYLPLNLNQLTFLGHDLVHDFFKIGELLDEFGLERALSRRLDVGS